MYLKYRVLSNTDLLAGVTKERILYITCTRHFRGKGLMPSAGADKL